MTARVVDLDALRGGTGGGAWFHGDEQDTPVSFVHVLAAPGDGPALHSHPYPEIFVVLEGTVTFRCGDEEVSVQPRRAVIAPAGVPHSFINLDGGVAQLLNIHPVREVSTTWLNPG